MAMLLKPLLLPLLFTYIAVGASATISLYNKCTHPVWPGIQPSAGKPILARGGFKLPRNKAYALHIPAGWSGASGAVTAVLSTLTVAATVPPETAAATSSATASAALLLPPSPKSPWAPSRTSTTSASSSVTTWPSPSIANASTRRLRLCNLSPVTLMSFRSSTLMRTILISISFSSSVALLISSIDLRIESFLRLRRSL